MLNNKKRERQRESSFLCAAKVTPFFLFIYCVGAFIYRAWSRREEDFVTLVVPMVFVAKTL